MLVLCGLGELTDLGAAILDAWVFKDMVFSGRNLDLWKITGKRPEKTGIKGTQSHFCASYYWITAEL